MGNECHYVYGVGDQQDDCVGCDADHDGNDLAQDAGVDAGEFHARLAGFLFGAGGDDDDVSAGADGGVVAAFDDGGGNELEAVTEIEGLSLDFSEVNIIERDAAGEAAEEAGVGDG